VLVTRGTNAGSMLADDLAGIVCEGRPQEIANAIVKAASAPDSLSSMAVCGLELVKSRTWERTSALLVGEYARKLKGIVE